MGNIYITTEIFNHCEQSLSIQPTPEFDGIEIFTTALVSGKHTEPFYINKEELPIIIDMLQQMMDYTNKTK